MTAATAYRVQVRAENDGGEAAWSPSASGTTGPVSNDNNAPKAMTASGQSGNSCKYWTDRTQPAASTLAPAGNFVSIVLTSRGTETGEWPTSCTSSGIRIKPVFDDRDAEALTMTMPSLTLPDNVRVMAGGAPSFFSDGSNDRIAASALAIGEATPVRVDLTATDPHGATVSAWVRFDVDVFGGSSAPQFSAQVADQSATRGEAFSLTLPEATGGDTTILDLVIDSPYVYAVSGLPPGLSFDPATRTISGAPTQAGSYTVTYTAADADAEYSRKASPDATDLADAATQTFTMSMTRPASAKLVGNTGQTDASPYTWNHDLAQPFTTGDNSSGYRLTGVDLGLEHTPGWENDPEPRRSSYSLSVHWDSAGRPGKSLGTLTNPNSINTWRSPHRFTASGDGIQLSANTTYWLVLDNSKNHYQTSMVSTNSDAEDSGAASGWSIGNSYMSSIYSSTSWDDGTDHDGALEIDVHGYARNTVGPALASAVVDGTTLTLNYNKRLHETSTPAPATSRSSGPARSRSPPVLWCPAPR